MLAVVLSLLLALAVTGMLTIMLELILPDRDCPDGYFWSWRHGRCVGSLEFDLR